ncbi:hypothetical protein INT47_000258 [Mucor saturninus]|uniref:DASH complex subunit DAM1 n=1 Tax=Mucor saturninus TaxID=64648 RepID=A0A8H7UQ19_9FUNG|nr:hypothetical protein INT47_000258 [Mucor saturninus]
MSNQQPDHKFDTLIPAIGKITTEFQTLSRRMAKLEQMNNSMLAFNESFGSFLYGLTVADQVTQWTTRPSERELAFLKRTAKAPFPPTPAPSAHTPEPTENTPKPKEKVLIRKRKASLSTPTTNTPAKVQKRLVSNVDIMKIIKGLPLMYREQTNHMNNMKKLLRVLAQHPEGLTKVELDSKVDIPAHVITPCINTLIQTKDVVKKAKANAYSQFFLERKP